MNFHWTEERVEELKRMWTDGASSGVIADAMGDGLTRSAVIGKLSRLGLRRGDGCVLQTRGKTGRPKRKQEPQNIPPSPAAIPPVQPCTAADTEAASLVPHDDAASLFSSPPLTLLELRHDSCRYPLGDPRDPDFAFCGALAMVASPYCGLHARICFQPRITK